MINSINNKSTVFKKVWQINLKLLSLLLICFIIKKYLNNE